MKEIVELMEQVYLQEMPRYTGLPAGVSNYDFLVDAKIENEKIGNFGIKLPNGLYVMDFGKFVYVWLGDGENPQIIALLVSFNNVPSVQTVGKLPGSSVYTSDFYMKIIDTFDKLLFSGHAVSDDAIKLWKNMVSRGMNVFVYDPSKFSKYTKVTSPDELDQYIGLEKEYENYRFVLSKNEVITESIIHIFNMYRMSQLIKHK
jgi:hypothetical protein